MGEDFNHQFDYGEYAKKYDQFDPGKYYHELEDPVFIVLSELTDESYSEVYREESGFRHKESTFYLSKYSLGELRKLSFLAFRMRASLINRTMDEHTYDYLNNHGKEKILTELLQGDILVNGKGNIERVVKGGGENEN